MQTTIKQQLSRVTPLTATVVLVFAAAMMYLLINSFAASGSANLYTSPAGTQSITNGQTFTVNVRISTGSGVPVTGGSVYLSYPASQLQVIGESYAGSSYTTELVTSNSGGVLRMDRAAFPMVAGGDQLFAQVSFRAIATGSAPISFTGNSVVTSGEDDSNILTQKNGVTYTIAAPATTPPPTTGSTSNPPASTSSGSSSGSSTPSHGSNSTASSPSSPGSTSSGSTSGSSQGSSGDGSQQGGTGADVTNSDTETTGSGTLSTIQIVVQDANKKPVENAQVTLNGHTARTDKNGIARFTGIATGSQTVSIIYNGKKTAKTVHVLGASTQASPELFNVAITSDKFNPVFLLFPLLLLVGAAVFFLRPPFLMTKFAKAPVFDQVPAVISSNQPAEPIQKLGYRPLDTPGTVVAPKTPDTDTDKPKNDTGTQ